MKQSEIDAIADSIRAAGIPDSLNRWIGMTPDRLSRVQENIARLVTNWSNAMPRTGAGPKIGPKEQALRDLRKPNLIEAPRSHGKSITSPGKNHGMPSEKRKALLESLAADAAAKHPKPEASAPAKPQEPKTMMTIKTNVPPTSPTSKAAVAALATAAGATPAPAKPETKKPAKKAAAKPAAKAKAKPAKKAAAKPAKAPAKNVAGAVTKSDVVHRMLTAANGTTREKLSEATGWPSVNLTVATERAQKKDPKYRLVEADGRVRLTTDPK